jgi:hypothetical protein
MKKTFCRRLLSTNGLKWSFALAMLLLLSPRADACAGRRAESAKELGVRNAHAMAYDDSRGRVVLFGGADAAQVCGDTWEWDGRQWHQVSTSGPGPRTFPAMAYDSWRKRVVLFGGNRVLFGKGPQAGDFLGDTWEWDGKRWRQLRVAGPPPRAEGVMTFDSKRGRLVLFGGHNWTEGKRKRFGDTWEWDGKQWTQVATTGPTPRNGAAICFDSARGVAVLFGGNGPSNETWEWDGRQWRQAPASDTPGRFNPVMAYDDKRQRILRLGGWNGKERLGDTWVYESGRWTQLTISGPVARNHAALTYIKSRGTFLLFGGHDGENVFGDTWELAGEKWQPRSPEKVQKRVENDH